MQLPSSYNNNYRINLQIPLTNMDDFSSSATPNVTYNQMNFPANNTSSTLATSNPIATSHLQILSPLAPPSAIKGEQAVNLSPAPIHPNSITHQVQPSQRLDNSYGPFLQEEILPTAGAQAGDPNLAKAAHQQQKPLHQPLITDYSLESNQPGANQQQGGNAANFRPTPKNIIEKNLIYVSEEIKSFFSRGTLLIKLISTTVILTYVFTIIVGDEQIAYSLALIPGRLYSTETFLWSLLTYITCPMVEFHFWQMAFDVISIYLIDNLVKPLWGQVEIIKFFVIVNVSVCLLSQLHYTIYAAINGHWHYLHEIYIHGLSSFCGAVCVTSKQLLPGSTRLNTRFGRFKNDHIALTALLIGTLAWMLNLIYGVYLLMFFYGVLVSWFYLRFCQHHPSSNGIRGDYSDSMAFVTFFPSFVQPILSPIFNSIFWIFVSMRILPPVAPNMRYESVKLQISQQLSTKRHARQSSTEIKSLIQNL